MMMPFPSKSSPAARRAGAWLGLFALLASEVRAHEPMESSTVARLQHGRLEMVVTLSPQMAAALVSAPGAVEAPAMTTFTFPAYRERLLEKAAALFAVRSEGGALAPTHTAVSMNRDGEPQFTVIFPQPKTWPAKLRAQYLQELPARFGGTIQVFDENEKPLASRALTREGEGAEVAVNPVPEPVALAPKMPPNPAPAPVAMRPPPPPMVAAVFLALGAGLLVAFRAIRQSKVPLLFALALFTSEAQAQRQMEKLGRGVVAVRRTSNIYVGWRLLGNDPEGIAFNLYRSANNAPATMIAGPISATTDYTDAPPNLSTTAYTYTVRPVLGGSEVADIWANPLSPPASLPAGATIRQYVPIPIEDTPDGPLDVKFCWVGDLDGNGEYDFVIDRQSAEGFRQFLEAYTRAGTLLWRMDLGPNSKYHYNIEPGSSAISIGHGDNVTVYDMDGDGLAEVIVRTSNGVVFGNGATVSGGATNDVQFLSIVNGLTGAEMARMTIPNPRLADGPMNGHMGIAYLDGQRPSVLWAAKNRDSNDDFHGVITAWDWRGGALSQRWSWVDSGAIHAPEGHQIRIGDVDNDGKDEFVEIGFVIDDNGAQLFNLGEVVHGDRFHMTDIDPDRPGLETFIIQQNNGTGLATALFDSGSGSIIRKWYAGGVVDVGRGVIADIDAGHKGYEMWSTQNGIFDAKGAQISAYDDQPFPPETIWWDGDLNRELIATVGATAEAPAISRFNPADPGNPSRIYTIYDETPPGVYQAYGGRPQFWGDLFGDWREEYLCVANDNSELRIYTTKTAATNRLYTLMHNPQYRMQTTTKGYVQSSYVDYYLGNGMTPPPPPPMVEAKLAWRGGAGATTWDSGATASWLNNGANSAFANGDTVRFDIGANNTTTIALSGALLPGAVTFYSPKNHTLDGTGGSLGGAMKLVKAGAGSLTISGNHNFTGTANVWDGALLVNGALQSSAVTVWGGIWGGALSAGAKGGRIGGTGNFSQPVAVKYRGAIVPGAGMGNAGTVTFGSGLTAEDGAVFALDLSDDPSGLVKANDRIAVTGNLALSGTVAIVVKPLNAQLAPGTYTLLTYGTLTGTAANFAVTVPPGTPYALAATGGAVTLTVPVTRAPASIVWAGGVAGNAWDLAASQNWKRSGASDVFVSGDTVLFDATGATNPPVTLSTALPIASATVNSSTNYTFTGTGSLSGAGSLTKNGTGTLTIATNNDYTGPTTINGGVLAVSSLNDGGYPSSLGAASTAASNFILNGGTLRITGAQTNTNRSLTLGAGGGTFDIASSLQISGAIGGSGALMKTGTGTLLLASANTYAGGTTINAGTVYLAGSTANESALGTGSVTLIGGGVLKMADVQNNDTPAWNLIVPAGQSGRLTADGRCSLNGTLTGGGDFTLYIGYVRTDLKGNWSAFTGRIFTISDDDGGDFRIANTNDYPNALLDLGDQVYAYYLNTTPSGGLNIDIGALSGVATSNLKGGPTGGRTVTYRIGARNTDTTFAGTITNGAGITALTKNGTGTWTLSGANTYTGATTVSAGILKVTGSLTGTASLSIAANATLLLADGDVAVTGTLTNTGTVRLTGNATLNSIGTFTNNGTLDLINAPPTLPANFVNNGTVLDASVVKVKAIALAAGNVNVTIQSYTGHNYQLQTRPSLTTGAWQNVGSPQAGVTGTVLTFANPAGTGGFYRVSVSPN